MLKGSMSKKMIFTFLFVILAYFLVINIPFRFFLVNQQKDGYLSKMKSAGNYLVDEYVTSAAQGDEITQDKFEKLLSTSHFFTGYRFWVVDIDGRVLSDSKDNQCEGISIMDYRKDYLDQSVITDETLDGKLENDTVSIICPIYYEYKLRGYLVLHGSYLQIEEDIVDIMFWVNMGGVVLSAALLITVGIYAFYYTRVIHKLIQITTAYGDGKFDERLQLFMGDEHQKLANSIVYLAEKNEGLIEYQKNFIANVSHDFRSPLTSIKGYTEAIKDGVIPPEAQEKYLDIILFETERLTGLTQNLLELNEFDNKGITLEYSEFNICQMIKQSAETFEAKCAAKELKIRLVLAEKEIWVSADKSKIQQVLHNLIDNAIKFSNNNNLIVVTVSEINDKIMVSVKDFGIGIPKQSLSQVWERFYKTDLSRGKDKKGTGLGLSITKQIINAHGESIRVFSKVSEGTEFKFTLKRVEKPKDA